MVSGMETIRRVLGYPANYYNCSGKTHDQWMATGERWPILGLLLIILGTLYIVLYLPTIYAMIKLRLYRNDCYKIMFALILADIGNLFVNSFMAGYIFSLDWWRVLHECGFLFHLIWSIATYLYVLLALNRFIIVLDNKSLHQAFMKVPFSLWLSIGIVYGLWTGRRSVPFNSKAFGALYIPVIEDTAKEVPMYANIYHVCHNVAIGLIMSGLYVLIFLLLARKRDTNRISKGEMNALVQAVLITIPAMMASWIYVYVQFFQIAALEMAITAHFAWQTTAGISALIYLALNHSIRQFYFGNRVIHSSYLEDSIKTPKTTSTS